MNRIPKEKYLTEDGVVFVTIDLIKEHHPEGEVEYFIRWFDGQTGILTKSGKSGIYVHDYEQWLLITNRYN